MKILVDGDDIIGLYPVHDLTEYRGGYIHCLPSDADGNYRVSSDGKDYSRVPVDRLWDYPLVNVNYYAEGDYECGGVSGQGVSMFIFELSPFANSADLELDKSPSFVTTWNGRTQLVFVLEDYIPHKPSGQTKRFINSIIESAENMCDCSYAYELLNPFCKHVITHWYSRDRMKLKDIMTFSSPSLSEEQMNEARGRGGIAAAKVRGEKSISSILEAIGMLRKEGATINQTTVAKKCGLSRKSVNKHWASVTSGNA